MIQITRILLIKGSEIPKNLRGSFPLPPNVPSSNTFLPDAANTETLPSTFLRTTCAIPPKMIVKKCQGMF